MEENIWVNLRMTCDRLEERRGGGRREGRKRKKVGEEENKAIKGKK